MDRTISNASQLSAIVRGRRKECNVSQQDAGALIAISQGRYSQLESQISELSLGRVLVLLRHLGLEMVVRESGADATKRNEVEHAVKAARRESKLKEQRLQNYDVIRAKPTLGEINKDMSMSLLGGKPGASNDGNRPSSKIKSSGKPETPPKGTW